LKEFLRFDHVTKIFGTTRAVHDVSLTIHQGEIFSLLGPSGCGKTTLLRLLAGFESPDSGKIILNGKDITALPPNQRKVNTVFQNYALFPHMSLRDNIGFGLKMAGRKKAEINVEVDRMLAMIQMEDQADRKPTQISGGQKQRIAIARALIMRPQILLLDEPLAALDLKLRQRMSLELSLIHDEVGITFLYVTHDQGEAMSLSDRIAVMNNGEIEQLGTPIEVYEAPSSSFVAAFIGDTNFFDARVLEVLNKDYSRVKIMGIKLPPLLCYNDKQTKRGDMIHFSIRPEKFQISINRPQVSSKYNILQGTIEDIIYQGDHTRYWVNIGEDWKIAITRQHTRFMLDEKALNWNDKVYIYWLADDGYMLEHYSAKDEDLVEEPPQVIGEEITGKDQEEPCKSNKESVLSSTIKKSQNGSSSNG